MGQQELAICLGVIALEAEDFVRAQADLETTIAMIPGRDRQITDSFTIVNFAKVDGCETGAGICNRDVHIPA